MTVPQFTAWNTVFDKLALSVRRKQWRPGYYQWLCGRAAPAHGQLGTGRPIDPATGSPQRSRSPITPAASVTTTAAALCCSWLPWETVHWFQPPPGQPRIGWNGYWGTVSASSGGFTAGGDDARLLRLPGTGRPPNIASMTDGTSNTIMVGEVLPSHAADSNFWMFNGSYAGTTVRSGLTPTPSLPGSSTCNQTGSPACVGCRFGVRARDSSACTPAAPTSHSATARSVSSRTASDRHLLRPGQPAGGEVISSDAY